VSRLVGAAERFVLARDRFSQLPTITVFSPDLITEIPHPGWV
jgi:hypothetical protein